MFLLHIFMTTLYSHVDDNLYDLIVGRLAHVTHILFFFFHYDQFLGVELHGVKDYEHPYAVKFFGFFFLMAVILQQISAHQGAL